MKYSLLTFGCRVNQADSLALEEQLSAAGAVPASVQDADLIVVNTCSVTASADQSARQAVRRAARLNPHARIVVTGCYATRRPDELEALPGVVRAAPNQDKPGLVSTLLAAAGRQESGDGPCGSTLGPGLAGRTAYTLCVQTGCEESCSYCVIPGTRGPGRSRPVDEVLSAVDRAAREGYKEIVLTGVHLGSYGRDHGNGTTLTQLLRRLDRHAAGVRYRVSSLEPMDCPLELVELVAESDRLAPHFHLPLQHASDRILQRMRRPYGLARYRDLIDAIRCRLPHASIGSDVLVGFPGETEEDVGLLLDYLERSPLTHLHVFPYSERPGTPAAGFSGRVAGAVVRERARRVRAVGARLAERFRRSQIGSIRPGLTIDDGSRVVTDNYLKVAIARGRPRNERVAVRITGMGEPMGGAIVSGE